MADSALILELVAALKHDLAKYVAWRSVNFGDEDWEGPVSQELHEALRADILRTHGEQPAWVVWDEFVSQLQLGWWAPELDTVHAAVEVLRAAGPALRDGDLQGVGAARAGLRRAQSTIRGSLRDLHRRLLTEG